MLEQMVAEQGTKQPRSEQDLAKKTELRPAEVRAVLNGLSDAGLVRPLDRASGVWELSHDFIARAVARFLRSAAPLCTPPGRVLYRSSAAGD
jgi:DNA-binding IclR family transcriptional regulator